MGLAKHFKGRAHAEWLPLEASQSLECLSLNNWTVLHVWGKKAIWPKSLQKLRLANFGPKRQDDHEPNREAIWDLIETGALDGVPSVTINIWGIVFPYIMLYDSESKIAAAAKRGTRLRLEPNFVASDILPISSTWV